jgi:hypothetical protein
MLLDLFTLNTGDQYYSNDSSWVSELLIQIISALLGFIGAYLLFQFGIKKERRINELKEETRLKDLLHFVKVSIQTNVEPINNQIKAIDELITQLKSESVIDLKLTLTTSLDFVEWMKSVDMKDLQKAFFLYVPAKNPHERYSNFIKHLLHLRNISDFIATDFKNIIVESNEFERKFDEGKTILFEKRDAAKKTYLESQYKHLQIEERELLTAVGDFFKETDDVKRNDMFYTYKHFVTPLIELAKVNQDPALLKGCRICGYAFESYKKVQLMNQKRFSNYKDGLTKANEFFPELISELEKTPTISR